MINVMCHCYLDIRQQVTGQERQTNATKKPPPCFREAVYALLACSLKAAHFALVRRCFALTPRLGTLIMRTPTSFGQDTSLLDFAVELFQCNFKRVAGIDLYFTHSDHQRDLPLLRLLERPALCPW